MKIHTFNPEIYPVTIWIAITSENKIEDFETLTEMDDSTLAIVERTTNKNTKEGGIFIRFKNLESLSADIIAHESSHVALDIFDYIGAFADYHNQEPYSYLVGWVAKCCSKVKEIELNK